MKYFAIFLLIVLSCSSVVLGQQEDVVKVKSNLVNIDVIVKDKKGKYIADLKAEDFTIVENGVPQKIEFFDAPLMRNETKSAGAATTVEATTTTPPSNAPRNYVALVIDSQSTDITNLKQVREGMLKYIREQITENDVVALLSVTNGLRMLQPFTQDKARLIAALENAGLNPSSKNFEVKDVAGNIESRREQVAGSTPAAITSTAAGAEAAKRMIAERVLAQFIQLRT